MVHSFEGLLHARIPARSPEAHPRPRDFGRETITLKLYPGSFLFDSLLREPDLAHQFRISWIGAQGIEREVGGQADEEDVAVLICDVEPLEGVILVADIAIQLGD